MDNDLYWDYPNEPIGGDNPYWRCISCGRSDPEINGSLEGHLASCQWANEIRKQMMKGGRGKDR